MDSGGRFAFALGEQILTEGRLCQPWRSSQPRTPCFAFHSGFAQKGLCQGHMSLVSVAQTLEQAFVGDSRALAGGWAM